MKQAVLPTGEVMHFPDETPDDHMHMQVRQRMGLPEPQPEMAPPPGEDAQATVQDLNALGAQITQSTMALHAQMDAVITALQDSAERQAAVAESTNAAMAAAVRGMELASQAMAKALTQTKTVTKGKDGRLTIAVGDVPTLPLMS